MKEENEILDLETVLGYGIVILMFLHSIYSYFFINSRVYLIAEAVCSIILFVIFYFFMKSKNINDQRRNTLRTYLVGTFLVIGCGFIFFDGLEFLWS